MKTITKLAVAIGGAMLVGGCSAGYPSTKERVEKVEQTMKNEKMTGDRSEVRDNRFYTDSGLPKQAPEPETPPKK